MLCDHGWNPEEAKKVNISFSFVVCIRVLCAYFVFHGQEKGYTEV